MPDEDPNDLEALDAAWEEAAVRFGPGEALDGCHDRPPPDRGCAPRRPAGRA